MLTVLLMFLNIKVSAELFSSCLGQNTIQTIKTITKAIDYFGVPSPSVLCFQGPFVQKIVLKVFIVSV